MAQYLLLHRRDHESLLQSVRLLCHNFVGRLIAKEFLLDLYTYEQTDNNIRVNPPSFHVRGKRKKEAHPQGEIG